VIQRKYLCCRAEKQDKFYLLIKIIRSIQKKNYFCKAKFATMLENISGSSIKEQFKSNSKLRIVTYFVGGLVIIALGYFLYQQFIWNPSNEKSKAAYFEGLNYAEMDSTDAAITSLTPVVKNYDGKIGGEIAQFTLARQLMNKGEFAKAIKELKGVKVKDSYVSIMAIGLQGDCKSEMKAYDEAANLYIKAAEANDNDFTTPTYLFKAAACAEKVNNFPAALELYKKIQDNYPEFANQKSIKKYVAKATKKEK
jgi:predicted negative regulator of RcsB-dependent stress response